MIGKLLVILIAVVGLVFGVYSFVAHPFSFQGNVGRFSKGQVVWGHSVLIPPTTITPGSGVVYEDSRTGVQFVGEVQGGSSDGLVVKSGTSDLSQQTVLQGDIKYLIW